MLDSNEEVISVSEDMIEDKDIDAPEWQKRDYRRQQIVEKAVEATDNIILDGSDGSLEETNYLTAEVARRLMQKALLPFQTAILKKDSQE